jgi:hypothetical protein
LLTVSYTHTQGKKLAKPYAKAILNMLPTTSYAEGPATHEPVNDVPVHSYTKQQIFLPTGESRYFTREDAAKAFHKDMLSVDERSAHKELINLEKAKALGEEMAWPKFEQDAKASEDVLMAKAEERRTKDEATTIRVHTDRFEFRFKTFNGNDVGKDGRKRTAVGWRYGAPLDDRKRGKVKIPTQWP